MDKVLLVVSDPNLRQLYHELLLSKNIEVLPSERIEDALPLFILNNIKLAIICTDPKDASLDIFLRIRSKNSRLQSARIVLITTEPDLYSQLINDGDKLINPDSCTPVEIISDITQYISTV